VPSRLLLPPIASSSRAAKFSLGAISVWTAIPCPSIPLRMRLRGDRSGASSRHYHGRGCVDPVLQAEGEWCGGPRPAGARTGDKVGGRFEHLIGVEGRRIDRHSVGCGGERSNLTQAVARVAFLHVLQDVVVYSRRTALPQLFEASRGACFHTGGDEQLHGRI